MPSKGYGQVWQEGSKSCATTVNPSDHVASTVDSMGQIWGSQRKDAGGVHGRVRENLIWNFMK